MKKRYVAVPEGAGAFPDLARLNRQILTTRVNVVTSDASILYVFRDELNGLDDSPFGVTKLCHPLETPGSF